MQTMTALHRRRLFPWDSVIAAVLACHGFATAAAAAESANPLKVALFVDNRAGAELDGKASVFEDFFSARVSQPDFQVLSREVMLNSLKDFAAGSASAQDTPGQQMDRALSDNTSALRLAQTLDADYVVFASLSSYGSQKRTYQGQGVQTVNHIHTLRVSYRLAEAGRGGEIGGDTITTAQTVRDSGGLQTETSDILNALLDHAAAQLAARLAVRAPTLASVDKAAARVKVNLQCTITEFAALPNVGLNASNEVVLGPGHAQAFASDVNVEVNGITLGSAPGTLEVMPGINKLRLTREGFKPYERNVNFYDGQTLTVALQMSEQGYARWKDVVGVYTALENNRKLTDAEVEVLEGYARMLRQSGIKVDTKEGIEIYRSLY